MSCQKRDREVELGNESASLHPTNKRTRLDGKDESGNILHHKDHPDIVDDSVLEIWSQSMTEQQKAFLMEQMETLVNVRSAADFIEPQTRKHMTLHAKKIKKPRDLSTMKSLVDAGEYSSVTELVTDFRIMISNALRINTWKSERLMVVGTLWKCFCYRMKCCPTGPQQEQMATYSRDAIKLMASEIRDSSTKTSTPSSEKSMATGNSDEAEVQDVSEYIIDDSEVQYVFDHLDEIVEGTLTVFSESPSLMQDEPPHPSRSGAAKTPEPGNLDDETRQLSEDIEECQQKLARMVGKKKLIREIRNLDTEKAAIDRKIPDMNEQLKQFKSKIQGCGKEITTIMEDSKAAANSRDWHDQESIRLQNESTRLQRESESHQKENERLRLVVDGYQHKVGALETERDQMLEQHEQAGDTKLELRERRNQIEDQQAVSKRDLDELNRREVMSREFLKRM
jgi:hypothetical protein